MHDEFMSKIPLDIQKKDMFFPADNEDAYRQLLYAFKLLITTVVMKFESLSRVSFAEQISIDHDIMDNLEGAEIREQILYIWGDLRLKLC